MEGRHLAILTTIAIWVIGYLISLFYFSYKFSEGNVPLRLKKEKHLKTLTHTIIALPIVSPILAGLSYRIGGILESGNGIAWGCYIEDFWLGVILLWVLSLSCLFILLLICMIKPELLGFRERKMAIFAYFVHHFYTLFLFLIMGIFIPILSGPLSGKGASCL